MIDKLDQQQTNEMLQEIDKNYADLKLNIPKPKYNKNNEWENEKEVKRALKLILPIILALWIKNSTIIDTKSRKTIEYNIIYYSLLKVKQKTSKTMLTKKEWTRIVDDIVRKRQKKIHINQVIRGNARLLNKKVQNTVVEMYKNGKNYKQTAKELQKIYGYNKNKAKSIAITEKNYYKSEAQLQGIKNLDVKKIWVYNYIAKEPREAHLAADGQMANKKGLFNVGGLLTEAPQHFGMPSEDINCHCTMRTETKETISKEELNKYLGGN